MSFYLREPQHYIGCKLAFRSASTQSKTDGPLLFFLFR